MSKFAFKKELMHSDVMAPYRHVSKRGQRKISVLIRRALHLKTRIEASPLNLDYDKAELAAILWCLEQIASHDEKRHSAPESSEPGMGCSEENTVTGYEVPAPLY